jgi:hypothetical protein
MGVMAHPHGRQCNSPLGIAPDRFRTRAAGGDHRGCRGDQRGLRPAQSGGGGAGAGVVWYDVVLKQMLLELGL